MEKRIRQRYHAGILEEAARIYGVRPEQIRMLDGFESYIFEFEHEDQELILRLGHSFHRTEALIHGEVDWINYLVDGGVSAARAVLSGGGNLVESIPDGQGEFFLATTFLKARGRPPWEAGWTPALYETYGKLIGRMHALTTRYQLPDPAWKRPEWDGEVFEFVDQFLPPSERIAQEKYRAVCDHLHSLPTSMEVYGLVHQDAHGGNLFVDEAGRLTLFDFDDCCYTWFANDIAIVLFYIVLGKQDPPAFTREFMGHFLRGYRQEYNLDPAWLKEIPYFLKVREIELYAVIHRDFDVNNLEDPWCARYMRDRKTKIEHEVPFIDFDFASLTME